MQLGGPVFTVGELDTYAKATGTHSMLGYYDVSAIEMAIQGKGYELRWFDARRPIEELDLNPTEIVGLLINISQSTLFFFTSRHWLGVKKVPTEDGASFDLYWMDSKAKKEQKIDLETCRTQCEALRTSKSAQLLFLVKTPPTEVIEETAREGALK